MKTETVMTDSSSHFTKDPGVNSSQVKSDVMSVCHICLSRSALPLQPTFASDYLTLIGATSDGRISDSLCTYCYALASKCVAFKNAALMARNAIIELLNSGQVSLQNLEEHTKPTISSVIPKMTTVLREPNTYDFTYNHEEPILTEIPQTEDCELKVEAASPYSNENMEPETLYLPDDNDQYDEDFDIPLQKFKEQSKDLTQKNHSKNKTKKSTAKKKITIQYLKKTVTLKNEGKKQPGLKKRQTDKAKTENFDEVRAPRKYVRKAAILSGEDKLMEEFFTIKMLSMQEQKDEFAKRKESANYNKSRMRCEYCFKGFMHQRAFEMHMGKHTQKMGDFSCKICHRNCATERILRKHMDHHKFKFNCKKCSFETKARNSAKLHIDWHNGKQYSCDKCGQVFMRISTLLSHARIKHPSDHVCGICGYSFLGEKGIYFHRQLKHKLEDNLTIPEDGPLCTECNIRFASEDALHTHMRVSPKHGECKRNDAPPTLKRHKGSMSEGRAETRGRRPLDHREPKNRKDQSFYREQKILNPPVPCEQCGQPMHSGMEYRVHFSKAHPNFTRTLFPGSKPSLCDICGKMFKTPAVLQDHMTEHADAPELYKCDTCGKGFRKKSSLALHKNIHLGKRYPCPLCGKMFNQVCNRDRHYTYVHSSIKDVKCDYCDKYFKSDEEKKLHTTYVHFKKPYPKRSRRRQIDVSGLKKKRDGYSLPEMVEHNWMRDSESSEGSIHH